MKYKVHYEDGNVQEIRAENDIDLFIELEEPPFLPKGIKEIECVDEERKVKSETIDWLVELYNAARFNAQYKEISEKVPSQF